MKKDLKFQQQLVQLMLMFLDENKMLDKFQKWIEKKAGIRFNFKREQK